MPPCKLPKSLSSLCLSTVESLVNIACKNIQVANGPYTESGCQEQIAALQEYLLSNIPGIVLDEVCEERKIVPNRNYCDQRIRLAVYMHPNMYKFSVNNRKIDIKLDIEDSFWFHHLSRLHNLVSLDLHLICTDEILEVVGNSCPKLEQINIVSKMEPVQVNNLQIGTFNALKLKFFVSDAGLHYLCNCKLLKKVTMNKTLRSQYGGRMMTLAGIRSLVKSLPGLQIVTSDDMGKVISEDMEDVKQLSLTHLNDFHPQPSHITAASRLCCNLQHLCLQLPTQTSESTAADILDSLTCSDLRVSILELVYFPFGVEMGELLESKGTFLRSLLVHSANFISYKIMHLIGQTCPYLKNLHLKQVFGESESNSNIVEPNQVYRDVYTMFSNLHCLYLGGRDWSPAEVLFLCLQHACQLETLTLLQMFHHSNLDDLFSQIIAVNPLKELRAVQIFTGGILSINTIHYFYKHCPKLTELSFLQNAKIRPEDVKKLDEEVKQNNLDLKIYSLEYDRLNT